MSIVRSSIALDPRRFGRRGAAIAAAVPLPRARSANDDLRLFATTFAAGFLFVILLIA